jgi:hypothetical protein
LEIVFARKDDRLLHRWMEEVAPGFGARPNLSGMCPVRTQSPFFKVKPRPAHFLRKPLKPLAKNIRQVCRLFPPSGAQWFHARKSNNNRALFPPVPLHAPFSNH